MPEKWNQLSIVMGLIAALLVAPAIGCGGASEDSDAVTERDSEPTPRPEIIVDPTTLRWGSVPPVNDPDWRGEPRSLALQNTGTAPLEISDIQIVGDDEFYWTLQQCTSDPDGGRICLPGDDLERLPEPIEAGESAYLRVWLRPDDRLPRSATLVITSDAEGGSTTEVSLETS